MKKTTADFIRNYCLTHTEYARSGYVYRVRSSDGAILRCKAEDVGREWFDHDGNKCDGWAVVRVTDGGRKQ